MINFQSAQSYNRLPLLPPSREQVETLAILRQESRASRALAELKGLSRLLPNPAILVDALVLKEAKASSEVENIITTSDQLYQALTAKNQPIDSATKEVLQYRQALYTGFRFVKERGFLSTNAIISIQQELEANQAGIRRLPGTALRNDRTQEVIYTPPDDPDVLQALMQNLELYLNINAEDDVAPLIKLAVQHYQFESIHPFYDGNGRTGRIINVLYLILQELLTEPILYISGYIIRHKTTYYRLLQEVRTSQNWQDWILFMLQAVEETARQTIDQILSIQTLFDQTVEQIRREAPTVYSKELVEVLFLYPYSKIEYVVDKLSIDRRTASKYLRAVEKIGLLRSEKKWKETLFINTRLFDLLKE
ncbi:MULTISPECIES: Fic family protein [unclassified Spirosoma]|uniref:Fic family protein n=1 Tax=unclassified Spirosoma TaxID=2621999 RepID=UPI00095BCE9F|nr:MULTISPECIES: Fic family protein [unclassified Spirosoma]MBN8823419.1 Fic family protein [Spirosoma sp.]OJW71964.1 MAG: addiction module protein [Spirosoma sp. 48-14]